LNFNTGKRYKPDPRRTQVLGGFKRLSVQEKSEILRDITVQYPSHPD